jgi:ribosomal protein S18 acetylase RimI-like enzyme
MIRPAQSNAADAAAFAELADMASGGLFSGIFGSRTLPYLRGSFLQEANDNSYQCAHFVTVESQIAGLLSGYSEAQKQTNSRRSNRLFLRHVAWGLIPTIVRGFPMLPVLGFLNHLPAETYYVQFVAVYPAFRGRGLSTMLLKYADERVRSLGCKAVALDVERHNQVAINAYLKHGMNQVGASPVVKLGGHDVGLYRMQKSLHEVV